MPMLVPATPPTHPAPRTPPIAAAPTGRRRPRRHGDLLAQPHRRALERSGWRTFLVYRENHVRAWDGTLLEVQPTWVAEAERADRAGTARAGAVQVSAPTADEAWALLHERVTDADRQAQRRRERQRLLHRHRPAA
jgi:hypothetical protein